MESFVFVKNKVFKIFSPFFLEHKEFRVPVHDGCIPKKCDIESECEIRPKRNFCISIASVEEDCYPDDTP